MVGFLVSSVLPNIENKVFFLWLWLWKFHYHVRFVSAVSSQDQRRIWDKQGHKIPYINPELGLKTPVDHWRGIQTLRPSSGQIQRVYSPSESSKWTLWWWKVLEKLFNFILLQESINQYFWSLLWQLSFIRKSWHLVKINNLLRNFASFVW